jgi:hypothetical protein
MLSLLFGPMKFTNKLVILSTVIALIIFTIAFTQYSLAQGKEETDARLSNFNDIKKFDSDGKFITSWGSEGYGDGQFLHAHGIDIDSSGNVYVVDSGNVHEKKDVCALQFFTSSCLYLKDNLVLILIIQDKKHFI